MKKIFNNVEFTPCTFCPACEPENRVNGLYIHDRNDRFGDGDGVIACVSWPENEQEAADMLLNEYLETDSDVLETVENRIWYAVMSDPEYDDWGSGSYDYDEAVEMVQQYIPDGGYIAVIEEGEDVTCVDEIHEF